MNANVDWNIRSRAVACHACHAEFVDLQPCHTLLQSTRSGYERIDLCAHCFGKQPLANGLQGSWKGVYRVPPPPARRSARKEDIETLLRRLVEQHDPVRIPMVFVLAVMLERKRILIERALLTRPDGIRQYVYEHRKTGETFIVIDPELRMDDIGELEQDVARQLALAADNEDTPAPDAHANADPGITDG